MFIRLWRGLIELSHDNDNDVDIDRAKRFINYALSDISNEFDWEFLRGQTTLTATAAGLYDINPISRLQASATVHLVPNASADDGQYITLGGSIIADDEITNVVYTNPVLNGLSGTGGSFSELTYIAKAVTTDSVFVTLAGGTVIATLGANDTYLANDIKKINAVTTDTETTINFDYNNQIKSNPTSINNGQTGYDIDHNNQLRVFSLPSNPTVFNIFYQRQPKVLIDNMDRTEFPDAFYPDIIEFAYKVYSKRFQDEADSTPDTAMVQLKHTLAAEIWRKWQSGKDKKQPRVMPAWIVRSV